MISRQWAALVLGLSSVISAPGAGRGDEPGWTGLEGQFRELPMEARRLTGPLFWLHGDESRERLESYVGKVAEGGNGTFTAESRPHRDWLGKDWYRDLQICLDAARRHNLTMWIFDEKWWPSQEVGGAVPPRYGSKRLAAVVKAIEGPGSLRIASAATIPNFLAVLAGKATEGGIDPSTIVDLTEQARAGESDWAVPAGSWRVMTFSWERSAGPRVLVDGASKDCVDWFLKTVYQPHYDRFGPEFGKTIVGFFYDEPETHGDWDRAAGRAGREGRGLEAGVRRLEVHARRGRPGGGPLRLPRGAERGMGADPLRRDDPVVPRSQGRLDRPLPRA
ncbi:MAG: hypothetical protein U0790_12435 [Isosphaeraceae bacterium]